MYRILELYCDSIILNTMGCYEDYIQRVVWCMYVCDELHGHYSYCAEASF